MIIDWNNSRKIKEDGKSYILSLVSCESPLHEGEKTRLIRKTDAKKGYGIHVCMGCKDRHYTGANNKNIGRKPSDKELARIKTLNVGRKASEETKRKMSLAHSGEKNHMYGKPGTWLGKKRPEHAKKLSGPNNYNWRFDLTDEERNRGRNSKADRDWAKEIKKIYDWTCQCCGLRSKKIMKAHHLDGYNWCEEKRLDLKNGKTLCETCHDNFHDYFGKGDNTKEQYDIWISYNYEI